MIPKCPVCYTLDKCLKKGKGEEQATAALCYIMLMIQLGAGKILHKELYNLALN